MGDEAIPDESGTLPTPPAGAQETIRPLRDYIVVKKDEIDRIGSIDLPENSAERATTGTAVAVGPEVASVPVGSRVLWGVYDGVACVIDGDFRNKRILLREASIIGLLPPRRRPGEELES
jgi:co-chaperonin GroES (HSP10)